MAKREIFIGQVIQCFQDRMFCEGRNISQEALRLNVPRSTLDAVIQGRRMTQNVLFRMSTDLLKK